MVPEGGVEPPQAQGPEDFKSFLGLLGKTLGALYFRGSPAPCNAFTDFSTIDSLSFCWVFLEPRSYKMVTILSLPKSTFVERLEDLWYVSAILIF
jgi:hypothetical protein